MAKLLKKELLIILIFVAVFILLRSINFVWHLNFSGDQAMFSTKALEIWRNKELVLIGPPVSLNFEGRHIFQGPMIYYEFLFFLLLGRFDPVVASYLFMLFCALMVFPLYYGVKMLMHRRAALIAVAAYVLLPYYIDLTRFLWNPTFQFSLVPVLLWLMGLYKHKKNIWLFLLMSVLLGVMLQYHYQFVLIILGLLIYYVFVVKVKPEEVVVFILGVVIGFFPIILFELRNSFYNTNTALLFLKHITKLDTPGGGNRGHYFLSLSFVSLVLLLGLVKKQLARIDSKQFKSIFLILVLIFTVWDLFLYAPKPQTSFWAPASNWNYPAEHRIYSIIKEEDLTNYNVANLAYDNLSWVTKYLLKRDSVKLNYDDYWSNKYLFVIDHNDNGKNPLDNPAIEIAAFKTQPIKLLKTWRINAFYNMHLVERLSEK